MREWERFLPPMPPPPFATCADVLIERLPTLRPARRVDVPTWAAQGGRRLSISNYQGPWKNDFAPYMVEPCQIVTSRKYGAEVFVGPARTAKSESLILNTLGHAIDCRPRDILVVCQTADSAKQFSEKKFAPMLRANEHLAAKQMRGRGADNIHEKQFQGNMTIQFRWPVIGYFSQNEYPLVVLTDRDRFKSDDIDGEGDPFTLARKRTQQAGSLGMVIEESSPGRPIISDEWQASSIHEAPPCVGILGDYNLGTRGRFYWFCPHCGDAFRPEFDRLHWETKESPSESARTVEMVCPNGCCIAPDRKFECNQAGVWLHESNDGKRAVELGDSAIRDTDICSHWCEGPVAALQNWEQLVTRYLQAKDVFALTGDDQALKSTINLDQGKPYLPAIREVGESVSEDTLKALAERYPIGIAPHGTRFITLQIDIQGNRFVVHVDAWGVGLERWLIDRFDIAIPPVTAPGAQRDESGNPRRAIDPARYFEDWAELPDLLTRSYPVADQAVALMPVAMIIDSAGRPGVTPNAYRFLRKMQKAGQGNRVFLAKGAPRMDDRAKYAEPEKVLQKKGRKATDIKLVFVGTNKLKDEVILSLTRKEDGPGKYHLSEQLPAQVFSELSAERRTEKGWDKRKSGLANEAFDLAVYGKALVIILKGETINWDRPPSWAMPANDNALAVHLFSETTQRIVAPLPQRRRRVLSKGI